MSLSHLSIRVYDYNGDTGIDGPRRGTYGSLTSLSDVFILTVLVRKNERSELGGGVCTPSPVPLENIFIVN